MSTRIAAAIHIFLGILLGLGSASAQRDLQNCILASESNEDIYKVRPEQIFATVFKLIYPGDSSKIISIINEDGKDLYGTAQDGLAGERRYFFKQCGSNLQPPSNTVPGFEVELPVQNIVVSSTTQIGHLMVLDRIDSVAVYIGGVKYITDQCFAEKTIDATQVKYTTGKILVYPTETDFADALEDPNDINRARLDELLNSKRTLALGPLGEGYFSDDRFVLDQDGPGLIPSIPVYASKEKSAKGKAVYMFSHLQEALACSYLNTISQRLISCFYDTARHQESSSGMNSTALCSTKRRSLGV